jgi:hypothetical protein
MISAQKKTVMMMENGKSKCYFMQFFRDQGNRRTSRKDNETNASRSRFPLPHLHWLVIGSEMSPFDFLFHSSELLQAGMHGRLPDRR